MTRPIPKGKRVSLLKGDCLDLLPKIPSDSIDLIFTSPPYADKREHDYGGTKPEEYVDWFLPIGEELLRVVKPTGSFVLNIREGTRDGERLTYVYELVLALRKLGWRWIEEYVWHKTSVFPTKHGKRFKNAYERLLHFARSTDYKFNKDAVAESRTNKEIDMAYRQAKLEDPVDTETNSGLKTGKYHKWMKKSSTYPSNVLIGHAENRNRGHSAAFPMWLPSWFIRLLTDKGDVVLDPFLGSGTTALASLDLGRKAVGMELNDRYWKLCREMLKRRLDGELSKDVMYVKKNDSVKREQMPKGTLLQGD